MRRVLILLLALGNVALAAGLDVQGPPPKQGAPGDYVALVFHILGQGTVSVTASADGGASLVVSHQQLTISGESPFFATVRVPDGLAAGKTIDVAVTAVGADGTTARASAQITVKRVVAPELTIEQDAKVVIGDNVKVHGYVRNGGNARDRMDLRPVFSPWPTSISPQTVTLDPGESVPVTFTIVPPASVSAGYRYLLRVKATSATDASRTAISQTLISFIDPRSEAIRRAGGLALIFGVQASGFAKAVLDGGAWSAGYAYSVRPSLVGALSDYVKGTVTSSPIQGSEEDPFTPPSSAMAELDAGSWNAQLRVSARSVDLAGAVPLTPDWKLFLGSGVSFGASGLALNGSAGVAGTGKAPDLNVSSSFFVARGTHNERFSVRYGVSLTPTVKVQGTATALGVQSGASPYYVIPSLSLDGTYRGPTFIVHGEYSTLPTFAQDSASLSVLSKGGASVGLNGTAEGTLNPRSRHATASLTVYGFPLDGTGISGTVGFSAASGTADYGSASAAGQVSTGFPIVEGGRGGLVASYAHTFPLWGNTSAQDDVSLSAGATLGPVHGQISGRLSQLGAGSDLVPQRRITANAKVSVTPTATTSFAVAYDFSDIFYPDAEVIHSYQASWRQDWGWSVRSDLSYQRTWDAVVGLETTKPESLTAQVSVSNFLVPGLSLNLGYSIESQTGLLQFGDAYTHTFSLGLGYDLQAPFKTPDSIVKLFGGRKSGTVYGRALVRRDGREQPLTGVTVALGDQKAVTGPDGAYELRVAPGVYDLQFLDGLPATLGLQGDPQVTVVLNQHVRRDLVFRPVTSLTVFVFDDRNHNGHRDPSELGIPYAGVTISGPVSKKGRADDTGRAVISGLPAGTYSVAPDSGFLPPGYVETTAPTTVVVSPPAVPTPVDVGASQPRKTVVTTFTPGDVSVFGSVNVGQAPAGSDITVRAMTTGTVAKAVVEMFGQTVAMAKGPSGWQAQVTIPPGTPKGFASGTVVANPGAKNTASSQIQFVVTEGRLFQAQPIYANVGAPQNISIRTLFKATGLSLRIAKHSYPLSSADGYLWQGSVQLDSAGDTEAHVYADGKDLGTLPVHVAKGGGGS